MKGKRLREAELEIKFLQLQLLETKQALANTRRALTNLKKKKKQEERFARGFFSGD